jgi:hypothetical protein
MPLPEGRLLALQLGFRIGQKPFLNLCQPPIRQLCQASTSHLCHTHVGLDLAFASPPVPGLSCNILAHGWFSLNLR